MHVLVTGGAGYIGTHTLISLAKANHQFTVMDNLSNSCMEGIRRVEKILNQKIPFVNIDLRHYEHLVSEMNKITQVDAVIHFAGLKAVGESSQIPLNYYENNLGSTMNLLKVMKLFLIPNLIFSSSATVYGTPDKLPLTETAPTGATNPYGRTKLIIEWMLADLAASDPFWNITALRYFNPVGAHQSGEIGEDPLGIPNNLMPFISQVAVGKRDMLNIFGGDYNTADGTCIRDFIHVCDLADGHIAALGAFARGFHPVNLGTGRGFSVLELVKAFEKNSGIKIPYKIVGRRAGDVAANWADPAKALELFGWKAKYSIDDICKDTWSWQKKNPQGYQNV